MRKRALETVYQLAKTNNNVVFIGSDIGAGTMDEFKKDFPDRFFMDGISEQHLIGFAAGLAKNGFIPFLNTIGTFISRRAYEQVLIDVGMHNLPVRLLASGGGLVYANLGPTHTAVEDIALISNVPNFRIFTPADALEMQSILKNTLTLPNPIYIRFGKGGEKIVTDVTTEINYNVPKIFSKINAQLIILTYGVLLQNCLAAQETLFNSGINVTVIHFPEITYPSMNDFLNKNLTKSKILIVEEHYPEGGLYTIISRYYFENKTSIVRIYQSCLPKIFLVKHGSQSENWKYFGLDSYSIAEKVQSIIYEL